MCLLVHNNPIFLTRYVLWLSFKNVMTWWRENCRPASTMEIEDLVSTYLALPSREILVPSLRNWKAGVAPEPVQNALHDTCTWQNTRVEIITDTMRRGLADKTREVLEDFVTSFTKTSDTCGCKSRSWISYSRGNSQHPSPNLRKKQIYYHINLFAF